MMESLSTEHAGGAEVALAAAQHVRRLECNCAMPHRDRDFDAFEALLGLRSWRH